MSIRRTSAHSAARAVPTSDRAPERSGVRASASGERRARRRHRRFVVDLPAAIGNDGLRCLARCTSLSLGGMFIATDLKLRVGQEVGVWLELPCRTSLLLVGSVRWCTREGVGIQHSLLGARDTFVLTEYLATLPPLAP